MHAHRHEIGIHVCCEIVIDKIWSKGQGGRLQRHLAGGVQQDATSFDDVGYQMASLDSNTSNSISKKMQKDY